MTEDTIFIVRLFPGLFVIHKVKIKLFLRHTLDFFQWCSIYNPYSLQSELFQLEFLFSHLFLRFDEGLWATFFHVIDLISIATAAFK